MNWVVYVLFSHKLNRTYVGYSANLQKRLKYHNLGKVKSTKKGKPWILVYCEKCNSYFEAIKKEKYYKSGAGRRKLAKIFKNWKGAGVV